MKRICAWCKKELKVNEKYFSDGNITHGICSLCAIDFTKDGIRTAREILDLINEPVFVIDSMNVVKTANKSGLKMLKKELSEIENELGGDAFEFTYANLDGGRGNTVHCKTCAIRNIVIDTLNNGYGYKNVPAYQNVNTLDGEKVMKYHISTEKLDDVVLLRIDNIG